MGLRLPLKLPPPVPADGALLLVELGLSEPNQPSGGKIIDLFMLVLTGGRERTTNEYVLSSLVLASASIASASTSSSSKLYLCNSNVPGLCLLECTEHGC